MDGVRSSTDKGKQKATAPTYETLERGEARGVSRDERTQSRMNR